jgi:hypothetical protein
VETKGRRPSPLPKRQGEKGQKKAKDFLPQGAEKVAENAANGCGKATAVLTGSSRII